jgi:putative ABC transport system permease protein
MFDGIIKDVGYALRSLGRSPVFTLAVVCSLALGIGGNTAIFSLIDQVLLRSLPVQNPQELVIVKSPGPRNGQVESDEVGSAGSFSYPMYTDLRDRQTALAGLLARYGFGAAVSFQGTTETAHGELVSGNYFELLGVRPATGRLITPADDQTPGASPVVVLGHAFWLETFGGRSDALNQQIIVNGHTMTIVGITPPEFFGVQLGTNPDVYVPMMMKAEMTPNFNGLDSHRAYWLNILGRLKPGTSAGQAQAQLGAVYRPLLEAEADTQSMSGDRRAKFTGKPLLLEPGAAGRRILSSETRQPLLVLMAMVGLVLLIACANVANLLVARATARERETAVRLAIGASRSRLIRQCLVESLVLSIAGAAAGLAVARGTIIGLLQIMPSDSGTHMLSAAIDGPVLLFAAALAIATGLLFGLLPAIESTRPDLAAGLKAGTSSSSMARHARIRKSLVVAQVAFTLLMVVGAALFSKTLLKLQAVNLGMHTENIVRFTLAPGLTSYSSAQTRALYERMQGALRTVPGITNASMGTVPIFAGSDSSSNTTIEGYTAAQDEDMNLFRNEIGPGYFATLGIPLVSGREFTDNDRLESPKVCIINQATADHFFKGRSPIGYHIAFGAGDRIVPDMTIVGVVQNSKHSEVGEVQHRFIYLPYTQLQNLNQITFYARTGIDATSVMNSIRTTVREIDPSLPIEQMKTLDTQIGESLSSQRLMTTLSIAFGVLSVLLAGFGIYGVMSYLVSRRTREIGIRMAVGAPPSLVRWMIVREVLFLAAVGMFIGLPLAYALGKSAQSLLFGMTGADLPTMAIAFIAVGLLALTAGYLPARRATRIDPVTALRNE